MSGIRFEWRMGDGRGLHAAPSSIADQRVIVVYAGRPALKPSRLIAPGLILLCLLLVLPWLSRQTAQVQQQAARDVWVGFHEALAPDPVDLRQAAQRQPTWTEAAAALAAPGSPFHQSRFGLIAAEAAPQVQRMDLAPDLAEATVVARQIYRSTIYPEGDAFVLEHVTVLRRQQDGQFLPAAPPADFWQEAAQVQRSRYLTLVYPGRDSAMANRLAEDLSAGLDALCGRLHTVRCPQDLVVEVILESDVIRLTQSHRPGMQVILPAPTLLGTPLGEAGYEALSAGYAAHVITAVATTLMGWDCPNPLRFYEGMQRGQFVCGI